MISLLKGELYARQAIARGDDMCYMVVIPSIKLYLFFFFLDIAALVVTTVAIMELCLNSHRLITRSHRLSASRTKQHNPSIKLCRFEVGKSWEKSKTHRCRRPQKDMVQPHLTLYSTSVAVNQDDDVWLSMRGTRHQQLCEHCQQPADSFRMASIILHFVKHALEK